MTTEFMRPVEDSSDHAARPRTSKAVGERFSELVSFLWPDASEPAPTFAERKADLMRVMDRFAAAAGTAEDIDCMTPDQPEFRTRLTEFREAFRNVYGRD